MSLTKFFFSGKLFCSANFFSNTNYNPARNPLQCCVSGTLFLFPIPSLPGHCPTLALLGLLPHPEGRKGLFKEQRGQRPSEELTLSLFWEIRHSRPSFILTRDYFKAPKTSLTSLTKSFPNTQPKFSFFSMSQSLLVIQWNDWLCKPVEFLSLFIPKIHVDTDALPLILFYDVFEKVLSTQRWHFKSCCGLILFCKHFKSVRNQR